MRAIKISFRHETTRDYVDGIVARACTTVARRRVCATGSSYRDDGEDAAAADALRRLADKIDAVR